MEGMENPIRSSGIDFKEIIVRIVKYVVEGAAVAIAAYFVSRGKLPGQEIGMIALTAAAVFAILDLYSPAVAMGVRQGAGFGLGFQVVQAPGITLPGVPPTA